MHSSRIAASLLVGLVASFSSAAFAEPTSRAPEPLKIVEPTKPVMARTVRPAPPAAAPHETPTPAIAHPAPVAIVLPTAGKPAHVAPTPVSVRRSSTEEKSAPSVPKMALEPQSSDPGITIKAEPKGNRIVVKGVAEGPAVKYLEGIYFENGKRVRQVDYEVARGVSFQIDHDSMPDFSKDPDYTSKNKWYFSHLADTGTRKGESAMTVAQHLAASLNKGGAYKATVVETDEGAAINLETL